MSHNAKGANRGVGPANSNGCAFCVSRALSGPGIRAAGIERSYKATDAAELETARDAILQGPGPLFAAIKVRAEPLPLVLPPRDGVELRDRFRAALSD